MNTLRRLREWVMPSERYRSTKVPDPANRRVRVRSNLRPGGPNQALSAREGVTNAQNNDFSGRHLGRPDDRREAHGNSHFLRAP